MPHSSWISQSGHEQYDGEQVQQPKRSRNPLSGLSRPAVLGGKRRDKESQEQRERSYSNSNTGGNRDKAWDGSRSTSVNTSFSNGSSNQIQNNVYPLARSSNSDQRKEFPASLYRTASGNDFVDDERVPQGLEQQLFHQQGQVLQHHQAQHSVSCTDTLSEHVMYDAPGTTALKPGLLFADVFNVTVRQAHRGVGS